AVGEKQAQEQARIEFVGARVTHVAALLLGEATRLHEVMYRLRLLKPALSVPGRDYAALGEVPCAIEGDPAHHLRLREVLGLAADLPDPGVGVAPALANEIGHLGQAAGDVVVDPVPAGGIEPRRLKQ